MHAKNCGYYFSNENKGFMVVWASVCDDKFSEELKKSFSNFHKEP